MTYKQAYLDGFITGLTCTAIARHHVKQLARFDLVWCLGVLLGLGITMSVMGLLLCLSQG
jgi:hypothetical protein